MEHIQYTLNTIAVSTVSRVVSFLEGNTGFKSPIEEFLPRGKLELVKVVENNRVEEENNRAMGGILMTSAMKMAGFPTCSRRRHAGG